MVTDLSSDILYFYINAMLELHSYIAHMWLRDIPEQVSYSWKLNLSVTKYKISLKQKCISINNEVNVTHCYFAKWQLIHCNQRERGGELLNVSILETLHHKNNEDVQVKQFLEHYSHVFPLRAPCEPPHWEFKHSLLVFICSM